ncbi:Vps51/Vps67-domain-containing protein [Mycena haematopus]|nr:Vps51/Vps67-domain-containing protein [Mycena haematopus]
MSTTSSPPATPRKVSIPRPPPSPLRPVSPTPSTHNTIVPSPLAGGVPRRTPASPPPTGTKTRARDLLRKHYGLGVGPPPSLPGKTNQDPMNLDSPAFDAKSYYEQLITTASLPALLKRENELLVEIRELDSERQSLVYNHHHELIAASDTIAAMKTRAESLDADLDLLRVAFGEISRLTSEVAIEDTPGDRNG